MKFYESNIENKKTLEENLIEEKVLTYIKNKANEEKEDIEIVKKIETDDILKKQDTNIILLINSEKTVILSNNKNKYYLEKIDTDKLEKKYKEQLFENDLGRCKYFFSIEIQNKVAKNFIDDEFINDIRYQKVDEDLEITEYEKFMQELIKKYNLKYKTYISIVKDYDNTIIKIEDISKKILEYLGKVESNIIKENPYENLNLVFDENKNVIGIKGNLIEAQEKCINIIDKIASNINNNNYDKKEELEYALEIIKFQYNIAIQIQTKLDSDAAIENYNNVLKSVDKVFGENDIIEKLKFKAECYNRIAEIYEQNNKPQLVLQEMKVVVKIRRKIMQKFENKAVKINNIQFKAIIINKLNINKEKDLLIDNYLQIAQIYYDIAKKHIILKYKANYNIEQAGVFANKALKIRESQYEKERSIETKYNYIIALNINAEMEEKSKKIMWRYYEQSLALYQDIILNSEEIEALKIIVNNIDTIYDIFVKCKKMNIVFPYMKKLLEQIEYVASKINSVSSSILLSTAYTKIGTIYCEIGETDQGIKISKKGMQLLQDIAVKNPDKINLEDNFLVLAREEQKISKQLEKIGNKTEAMQHFLITRALLYNLTLSDVNYGLEDELKNVEKHLNSKYLKKSKKTNQVIGLKD